MTEDRPTENDDKLKTVTTFWQSFAWRDIDSSTHSVVVSGCASPQDAQKKAKAAAVQCGWKPLPLRKFVGSTPGLG